jgi:uncharacterized protein
MIKVFLLVLFFGQSQPDTTQFFYPAEIIKQGSELSNKGEYEKAIDLYRKVSTSDTSYIQVQAELMNAYNNQKQYDKSIQIGKELIKEQSAFRKNIYVNLGNALLESGQPEEAKSIYKEGLKHYPYSYLLLYNLGFAHYKLNNMVDAMSCFQRSAELNPFYGNNHILLGYLSMLQGHRSKAIMSYLTYMAINPDRNSTLVFLEKLAAGGAREEGSMPSITGNEYFSYYDDLLRSNAALDPRFKTKVDFNASIIKQSELLFSKLVYDQGSNDFWMRLYVPLYKELVKNDLQAAFLNYILKSSNNDGVKEWLQKHSKENDEMINVARNVLSEFRATINSKVLGEQAEYNCSYYDDNTLSSIGNEKADGTRMGPWEFYYQNSQLNAAGKYNATGAKIGEWSYYHANGRLSRNEEYDISGKYVKPVYYYHENGALSIVAHYNEKGELHGPLEYYFLCGLLKERMPVVNGLKTGTGQHFYETGQVKTDYNIKEGILNGEYIDYYQDGTVQRKYNMDQGKTHGPFQSFFANGLLDEQGQYVNDSSSGHWVGHHPNGKQRFQGDFANGVRVGTWKFNFRNGETQEIVNYNNAGDKHGENQVFTEAGLLQSSTLYDQNKVIGVTYYDSGAKVIYENKDALGNMDYETYYPSGELTIKCTLKNGKLNGQMVKYHRNGILELRVNVVDDLYEGLLEEFYETGELHVKAFFKGGKKNGRYLQYYKNGKIEYEGWYIDDVAAGLTKLYHPDGTQNEEKYFIAGKINGWNHFYGPGNILQRSYLYDMDLVAELVQYDTLGNVYHHLKLSNGNGMEVRKTVAGDTLFKAEMTCGMFTSNLLNYYKGGSLKSNFPVANGQFNGKFQSFDSDGTLYVKGHFKNGERSGQWNWYHNNGKLSSEDFYELGKLESESKDYYYNGNIEIVQNYSEDELVGAREYFDLEGNHMLTKLYEKGIGAIAYVDVKSKDTVRIENTGLFTLKSHYPQGQIAIIQPYFHGNFDGELISYNLNGSLLEKIQYLRGEYHGITTHYYSNGKPRIVTPYNYDKRYGLEVEYYENGKKRRETHYLNDDKNGYEILYNADGSVKSKIFYWNDYAY